MRQTPHIVAAALSLIAAGGLATALAGPPAPTEVVRGLSTAVEASVASTRPPYWPMRRACLYYAMAGQALLADHGIAARLRVGQVVYWPGTAAAHPIAPHAWLETGTDFIDYATLPRWGEVAVIPRDLVATEPAAVVPGATRVLAISAELDGPLALYLDHHYRLYYGRSTTARRRRCARRASP